MAVTTDIVDGSALVITNKKWSKTLIAMVEEVTGTGTYAKELNARGASGIPAIGSVMGTMKCVSHSIKMLSPDSAKVTIQFESGDGAGQADPQNPDLPTYEVGTQLQQINTRFMADGTTPILVEYNDVDYPSSVTVDDATDTLRVSRVETGIAPGQVSRGIKNKVNATTWQGDEPGTWRCVDVQGTSSDGGITWAMVYEFQYLKTKHQPIAVAIDPATGEMYPDADLATSKGAKTITWYESFNFNLLNL